MTQTTTPDEKPVSRRDFMKTAWAFLGGLVAFEAGGIFIAYLQPRLAEGEFGSVITAGAVDDFPPNSVTHISTGRFYIVRDPDGGFLAVYHRCTHLGCTVPWDEKERRFPCPCHASVFDMTGQVLNPPAPRALDLHPVTLEGGLVRVDPSRKIQRQRFEPSQVTRL